MGRTKKEQHENAEKHMMTFGIDKDLKGRVDDFVAETGIKKSEIGRRALHEFFEGACNEGQFMMNFTLLIQHIQDTCKDIDPKDYKRIEDLINNIVILKGGR